MSNCESGKFIKYILFQSPAVTSEVNWPVLVMLACLLVFLYFYFIVCCDQTCHCMHEVSVFYFLLEVLFIIRT